MEFNQLTFQGADMLLGAACTRTLLHVTDQTDQETKQESDHADAQDKGANGQMPAEGNQPDGFQIRIAQGKTIRTARRMTRMSSLSMNMVLSCYLQRNKTCGQED